MATVAGLEEYFTHSGTVEAARRSAQAAGEVRRVGDAEGAEGAEIAAAAELDLGRYDYPKSTSLRGSGPKTTRTRRPCFHLPNTESSLSMRRSRSEQPRTRRCRGP